MRGRNEERITIVRLIIVLAVLALTTGVAIWEHGRKASTLPFAASLAIQPMEVNTVPVTVMTDDGRAVVGV